MSTSKGEEDKAAVAIGGGGVPTTTTTTNSWMFSSSSSSWSSSSLPRSLFSPLSDGYSANNNNHNVMTKTEATVSAVAGGAKRRIFDFMDDIGAIPGDLSSNVCEYNTMLLSNALQYNVSGDYHDDDDDDDGRIILIIPENYTFHLRRGVYVHNMNNAIIQIDGTIRFERGIDDYYNYNHGGTRRSSDDNNEAATTLLDDESDDDLDGNTIMTKGKKSREHIRPCILIHRGSNITITSRTGTGLIDGRGSQYWRVPYIGFLQTGEDRPRLLKFERTQNILIERIILKDSPYHTLYMESVNHAVVRYTSIIARRTTKDAHTWIDLSAFNTDGIDVSGHNVHVHDIDIWTQDDCIAVKDNMYDKNYMSSNMTFERINASGLGFSIGSIGGSIVNNITFRDSYLHKSVKGIYLKFHKPDEEFWKIRNITGGSIQNVQFHNITMEGIEQWSIWIGPAQQADQWNPCHPNPCSLCWPITPGSKCYTVETSQFANISLSNIIINNPKMSTGVIMGGSSSSSSSSNAAGILSNNPIRNVTFEDVRVTMGPPIEPYASQDLTITFPGLKQPIIDRYVHPHHHHHHIIFMTMSSWSSSSSSLVATASPPPMYDDRYYYNDKTITHTTTFIANSNKQLWFSRWTEEIGWWSSTIITTMALSVYVVNTTVAFCLVLVVLVLGAMMMIRWWWWCLDYYQMPLLLLLVTSRKTGRRYYNTLVLSCSVVVLMVVLLVYIVMLWQSSRLASSSLSSLERHHNTTNNNNGGTITSLTTTSRTTAIIQQQQNDVQTKPISSTGGSSSSSSGIEGRFIRRPEWGKTDRYYECRNVVDGIAKGNTWPIPACFRHEE